MAEQAPDKVNILLVDDQVARLVSYESILRDLGYNLVRATSGREALEKLMAADYAVILLDVSMPGMDGFETASLIHEHPRFERTPIIFVTGVNVSELDRLKGYKVGAVDYVHVPVVPEILRGKVSVLVELYLKRRELQLLNRALQQANVELAAANTALQAEKTRELEQYSRELERANAELGTANLALRAEIAERARIEQQLKQADRHKDEFLAMLAHELRNPLAPIRNAVQIMRRTALEDAQFVWTREVIERQLSSLTRLVDDLLDVSRITRGKINISREPLELGAVIAGAVETVQPLIAEKNHQLELDVPDPAVSLEGDLTRLTQVVGNILANAAKYTDSGGRITLCGRKDGPSVEIRVRDSGIGIAPDQLPRIFDLFTQAERVDERARGGLGIGLALVRRLVELHGGTVSAASDGPGRGAEFLVRLPRRLDAARSSVELTAAPAGNGSAPVGAIPATAEPPDLAAVSARRRILIVDDNRDALESLAALMEMAGHLVSTAADGELALALARDFQPDLVLLDLGLPKLDGYEVARRIRREPWGKSLVLVALTGWGQETDRRRTRETGFDSHLVKPLDFEMLTQFLRNLPPPQSAGTGSGPALTPS
ncbi:MAG TPA: response regulator [Steroidobacteraceae bacterium]|nr:response regulator [Steroidobacteraceae bacterium]